MTDSPDLRPSRPFWQRALLVATALALLVGAALAGRALAPLIRGGKPAAPPAATLPPPPAPAPTAAPPAPEPATPPHSAARDTAPRPRRRTEPPKPAAPEAPPTPTMGELRIDSDVPGAMVFLDRKFLGNTPVVARDVTPGTHHLNLSAEGYDGYSEPIEVAPGPADILVRFKEVRLKEAVAVVHKHAVGSCEGQLLADPQGIRYEPTQGDHGFTVGFADIQVFEVDYLQKNLRIRKRDGRTYNFTTRAPNADPLFVFHQKVEKVRQRVLAAGPGRH